MYVFWTGLGMRWACFAKVYIIYKSNAFLLLLNVLKSSPAEKCTRITKNQWFWEQHRASCDHKSKSIKKDNVFQYFFEPYDSYMMPSSTKSQTNCTNMHISKGISILLASWAANPLFLKWKSTFSPPASSKAAQSSQEQPGSSQEQPGAARRSQEQPEAAQEQPGAARSSQEQLGGARSKPGAGAAGSSQ